MLWFKKTQKRNFDNGQCKITGQSVKAIQARSMDDAEHTTPTQAAEDGIKASTCKRCSCCYYACFIGCSEFQKQE